MTFTSEVTVNMVNGGWMRREETDLAYHIDPKVIRCIELFEPYVHGLYPCCLS